jgi:hypothetical protein
MKKWTILGLASVGLFALGAFTGQQLPAQPAVGKAAAIKEPTWVHAFNLAVRSAGERNFTKDTKKFSVEVFRDENNGNLVYVSETGSIAVVPAK